MVSRQRIRQRQYSRWDGVWFRDDPNRGKPGYSACFECHRYTTWHYAPCAYGNCTETYCGSCGRYEGGSGPVGCPCDHYGNISGSRGHRTRAEQVGVRYKLSPNPDPESFEAFVVRPIRKRKPSKRRHR